jgi:large subunit ribosomal protein L15
MMIHDVTVLAGRYKDRKRVGRGEGSGHGKQSGRGNKGAGSRSGTARKTAFEGGQMPYFRRLAKFGFTNAPFKQRFWIVNLADILAHPLFAKGGDVTPARLQEAGLIRDDSRDVKVLGDVGEDGVRVKLNVAVPRITAKARQLVVSAGGSVNETGTRKDFVRGVDRASGDLTPKKMTKRGPKKAAPAAAKGGAKKGAKGEDAGEGKAPAKGGEGEKA